jgi:hypothetical protein
MLVALTVGLSVASRTISNLKISKQNEESQRAFNAAEAGVDIALQKIKDSGCTAGCTAVLTDLQANGAKYKYDVSPEQSSEIVLNGGDIVHQAVGMDVWLSNYQDFSSPYTGKKVTILWGDSTQSCTGVAGAIMPAIEVMALYNPGTLSMYRQVFDPCGRVQGATGFTGGGSIDYHGPQVNFANSAVFPSGVTTLDNILVMTVTPIYNSTHIGIKAATGFTLPSQGAVITSTGKSGDTVRKIQYFQSYPQIPDELFHYAIISQ